jgi:hypothetical protein
MRYFVITYIQKPNGQYDEQVEVTKKIRQRDLQCANVILDFKTMRIEKAMANGQSIERDWDRIHDFYLQHYRATFERLHRDNGRTLVIENESNTSVDSATATAG